MKSNLRLSLGCWLVLVGWLPFSTALGQLQWGSGGAGGSGTWNPTNSNWWNGTSDVVWDGGTAVFGGAGGTVTPGSGVASRPNATGLTFNSPGYTIQGGGGITARNAADTAFDFLVTANEAATISSQLRQSVTGTTLVKTGPAALTVSGSSLSISRLRVEQGEYRLGSSSDLSFSDVVLADFPGVVITLGQSTDFVRAKSLSGGGSMGGIVQPNDQARTVIMTIGGSGTFGGILQDNGAGKLAIELLSGTGLGRTLSAPTNVFTRGTPTSFGTEVLTNANTYSGATMVSLGNLELSGSGSALNSAMFVFTFGTLRLDNTAAANGDRLSNTLDLTIKGGRLEFLGHGATAIDEQAGPLKFSGAISIQGSQAGAVAGLTFASAERINRGTVDFSGDARVKWNGMMNNSTGIVGAYATMGDDWATVGPNGGAEALGAYALDLNAAAATNHVKLAGGGNVALAATATRATLNLQNNSGAVGTLDLGAANTLTLSDGGLLSSGNSASRLINGTLRPGGTELVVTTRNDLTIAARIGQSVAGSGLTKSGAGTLTLTGSNTYSGNTVINEGTLVVASDANLGTGTTIEFNGGALKAAQSFASAKRLARGTDFVGTIDTAGFNVTFSGAGNGAIEKVGAGTLTLTAYSGTAFVTQGILALPNAASGSVVLQGGDLLAAGDLSALEIASAATLDLGGSARATLSTSSVNSFVQDVPTLTVRFGIGANTAASDRWHVFSSFGTYFSNLDPDDILFDFQNLSGATTGTNYPVISFGSTPPPFLAVSAFDFAPAAVAAGWSGTFSIVSRDVVVRFDSVPEPSSGVLLCLALLGVGNGRWRKRP